MEKKKELIAILGGVLAFFIAGFTIGGRVSSERADLLKEQVTKLEKELAGVRENLKASESQSAALKAELSAAQAKASNAAESADERSPQRSLSANTSEPVVSQSLRKITVAKGDTGEIKGELLISVPSITAAYEPFRYVVSVRASGTGSQVPLAKELTVGEGFDFGPYNIRLFSANLAQARFVLQKR